jgi:hypothetical protein
MHDSLRAAGTRYSKTMARRDRNIDVAVLRSSVIMNTKPDHEPTELDPPGTNEFSEMTGVCECVGSQLLVP